MHIVLDALTAFTSFKFTVRLQEVVGRNKVTELKAGNRACLQLAAKGVTQIWTFWELGREMGSPRKLEATIG
jgi:hypothetical protein